MFLKFILHSPRGFFGQFWSTMRHTILLSLFFIATISSCKKDQPIPDKLQGYWNLTKTHNIAYQTTAVNLSGNCLHFTTKAWSPSCKSGGKSSGRRFLFTPDANDATRGTIKFDGRKLDPDTYTISWSGDTLIMTPPSEVYDIKYYLPEK